MLMKYCECTQTRFTIIEKFNDLCKVIPVYKSEITCAHRFINTAVIFHRVKLVKPSRFQRRKTSALIKTPLKNKARSRRDPVTLAV